MRKSANRSKPKKARAKAKAPARAKAKTKKKATIKLVAKPPPKPTGGVTSGGNPRPRAKSKAAIQAQLAEAYQIVFSSPLGALVKADLLTWCNVYNPVTETDPISVGVRMGERNVGLRIAQMMGLRAEHFNADAWAAATSTDEMMGAI